MNLNPKSHPSFQNHRLLNSPPAPRTGQFDAAVADLRRLKDDLQGQVRRGETTLRMAREAYRAQVESARNRIQADATGQLRQEHPLASRLRCALLQSQQDTATPSLETLQRETNRLLKLNLVEQQILARQREFEAKTHVRTSPAAPPAPTVDSLILFHQQAKVQKDEAATEWARRQLDVIRPQVVSAQSLEQIDRATEQADRPNPRIIDRYIRALEPADAAERERFVSEALASADPDACIVAYLMARDVEDGHRVRWVRQLADGLDRFPTEAIEALCKIEDQERERRGSAIDGEVQDVLRDLSHDNGLPDSLAPSPEHMEHQSRIAARPLAQPGESIGLAVNRRGSGMHPLPAATKDDPSLGQGVVHD